MKPLIHGKISAKKYGGTASDYQDIHDFFDSSKAALPDMRHRAILHSSFGIFVAERVFGPVRTNSDGKEYSVRDICEDHVIQDLGFIPTPERWFEKMPIEPWMTGSAKKTRYEKID